MIQPLKQEDTATFTVSPQEITFTFPPVPQGLVWTGNIAFSVRQGTGPDLQGIVWTAYRNGFPVLTWQEFGVACDLQAVGAEVITVVGVYMGSAATVPLFEIKASWTGWSCDTIESEPRAPWVAGSNRGLVQVYNSNGPNAPLAVVLAPQGTVRQRSVNAASSSVLLLGTPVAGHPYRLWELTLQITGASLAAEIGAKWLTATVSEDTTAKVILEGQVSTVPGTADSCTLYIPLHGYTMPDGAALLLATGAFTGANANATGTVVYETT